MSGTFAVPIAADLTLMDVITKGTTLLKLWDDFSLVGVCDAIVFSQLRRQVWSLLTTLQPPFMGSRFVMIDIST